MHFTPSVHALFTRSLQIGIVVAAASGAALAEVKTDPLAQRGTLQDMQEPIGKLLKFNWSGGTLKLKRLPQKEEFSIFDKIAAAAGRSGGSGSSSSRARVSKQFSRTNLHGELLLTDPKSVVKFFGRKPEIWLSIRVALREQNGPQRSVVVEQDGQGRLELLVKCDLTNYLLIVRQKPDGSFLVQEVGGGRMFAAQETSFLMFCCKHRKFANMTLLPLMKHLGIVPPKTSHNPTVDAAVLARLQPVSDKQREMFQKLLNQLNDDNFAVRGKATRALTQEFAVYQTLVRETANDKSQPPEVRTRIAKILESKRGADGEAIDELMAREKLCDDPFYLISLLERTEDPKHQSLIAAVLKQRTKQPFGVNVAQWWKWVDSAELLRETSPRKVTNPPAEKGPLQGLAKPIGQLLKFTLQGQRLHMDRQHWQQPFGGKTIAQLEKEIKAEVVKRGLPRDWFSSRHKDSNCVSVLFYRLCQTGHVYTESTSGKGWDSSTRASSEDLETRLVLKPQASLRKTEESSFRFAIREKKGTKQSIDVFDDGRGAVTMLIRDDASNFLLRLAQETNGTVTIHEFRGANVFSAKAGSFRRFCEQNSELVQKTLFPLMKHMGMLPPEI